MGLNNKCMEIGKPVNEPIGSSLTKFSINVQNHWATNPWIYYFVFGSIRNPVQNASMLQLM